MTFSLVAYYFLPLRPKYSPKYLVAKHLPLDFIINNQRDAALISLIYYLLRDYSTCFGCSVHPSSGVH